MEDTAVAIKPRSQKVTIYDVAREAHVATSTVSRALNRPGRTNEATAQLVQRIAAELGYVSPTHRSTPPPVHHRRLASFLRVQEDQQFASLTSEASRYDYDLVSLLPHQNSATNVSRVRRLQDYVDGFLFCRIKASQELTAVLQGFPCVWMNESDGPGGHVLPQVELGMRQTIAHLKSLGHRAFTYLQDSEQSWLNTKFCRMAREISARENLEMHLISGIANNIQSGARAVSLWRKQPDSAVVFYGVFAAAGFMQTAQRYYKLNIPRDVSILAIGESLPGSLTTPGLTTLEIPYTKIGIEGIRLLVRMIEHPTQVNATSVKVPLKFINRQSTGVC